MSWLSEVRERVRGVLFRGREAAELREELRMHVELQSAENERQGMSPAEARRQALIALGGEDRISEEVREERGTALVDEVRGDVRYAWRALGRNPAFTAVALLTLALGIGANAAVFSIVNGVLLRPLPYPASHELALVHQAHARSGEQFGRVSYQDFEDLRARTRSLSGVAAFAPVSSILMGDGHPHEVEVTYVTESFFEVLGVPVLRGRSLLEEDFRQQRASAVVSEAFWRGPLAGAGDVVGSTIELREGSFTVVGVMPAAVRYPTPETDVWIPHSLIRPNTFANGMPQRGDRYLQVVGRLAAGADAAQAQRELTSLAGDLAATHPETNEDWTAATVVPLQTAVTGDVNQALLVVLGIVGFILLIGCANLANLMLARGSARTREIAIRAALGAGRGRIMRQLLTESLVLAVLGGALGLLFAYWGVQSILGLSAETLPRVEDVSVDVRVVAFGLLLAGATGLLFGIVPALRLASTNPQQNLRGGRGTVGADGGRLRSALVVAEVALAVLLVIGAGLMARSFLELRSVDAGFDPERVLTVAMQVNFAGVPEEDIASFLIQRREEILERVRALPGVESAGMINVFPLRDRAYAFSMEYRRGGADAVPGETGVHADTRYVDAGYLATMGIPLLRGEGLPAQLPETGPLEVVLSESAARRLWPQADPVGRLITVPWGEARVVGVVGDVRQVGLADTPQPAVYFSHLHAPRLLATLVLRTAGDPGLHAAPVRAAIREVAPNQPIRSIVPLREVMAESIARDRFFTVLFAAFGGLALALAAIGIYGVLAYTVRQRTQEIGVRMALGASRRDILRMVSGAGMALVGIGVLIGTAAALALSRVLASQLYGVAPTDPGTFAAAIAFLLVTAFVATYVPARRAMRVPPMTALRPD
jgi:predicted permease